MHYIFIDIETTGLGKRNGRDDAIYEVGAVAIKEGGLRRHFAWLCNPGKEYFANDRAAGAMKNSHKTTKQILRATPIEEVAKNFREWLSRLAPSILFFYNREFDTGFLFESPWNINTIDGLEYGKCVMIHAAEFLGEQGKNVWSDYFENWKYMKLIDAAIALDIDVDEKKFHGALYDADIAAKVALKTGMIDEKMEGF